MASPGESTRLRVGLVLVAVLFGLMALPMVRGELLVHDDLAYYYAAPVAAAQFRENAVDLTLGPGPTVGATPIYELTPAGISGLQVDNRMSTGAASATAEFVARRAANSPVVVLEGVVPAGSKAVSHPLSVHDPVRFLAAALAEVGRLLLGCFSMSGLFRQGLDRLL